MPEVKPDLLTWARETAGLTLAEAARKLQIADARGRTPAQRLAALETGTDHPTRAMLAKMSRCYRRPLIAFYLDGPPRPSNVGTDFRTLKGEVSVRQNALVQTLVREVRARQGIVRDQLEYDEEQPVTFVGSISMANGQEYALQALRNVIDDGQGRQFQPREFDKLRAAVERAGVFVQLQGDLGSHHTALGTTEFRGFVLADRMAPFVVINSNDARAAWSFTLLHEVVHLLLGDTGISGAESDSEVERFCNDVASEYLLPSSVVNGIELSSPTLEQVIAEISELATDWKLSRSLIAYRLCRAGKIDLSTYRRIAARLRSEWNERRRQGTGSDGWPNPYVVKRHRIGKALLKLVERSLGEGTLATTKAALVLGVKPTQVGPIVGMAGSA